MVKVLSGVHTESGLQKKGCEVILFSKGWLHKTKDLLVVQRR